MQQDNIELFFADTDDAWARDVAPTFVKLNEHNTANSNKEGSDQSSSSASDSVIRAVNWEFNAWGGNVDGLYASREKTMHLPVHLQISLALTGTMLRHLY